MAFIRSPWEGRTLILYHLSLLFTLLSGARANCLSRDILALLRLSTPITRGETMDPSLSLIFSFSPFLPPFTPVSSYVSTFHVHPRRRIKLQILHSYARANTATLVSRKPFLPHRTARCTKDAFEIRQAAKSFLRSYAIRETPLLQSSNFSISSLIKCLFLYFGID